MTYEEANLKLVNAKRQLLNSDTLNANVPHFIEGFIIAPIERDNTIEGKIFDECVTNKKDNKETLKSIGLLSKDLAVFIIVLARGENICLLLDSYFNSSFVSEKGNIS